MNVDLSKYRNRHSLGSKLLRLLWGFVWTVFARPTPRWCFNWWRNLLLRLFGAKVGGGARVNGGAIIWQPWNLVLGRNCWVGDKARLYAVDKIAVGDNTVISERAFVCAAQHDVTSPTFELVTAPIAIGHSVWIAAGATVLPGRKIGDGAVVGTGAVVVRDVAPWTVVGGNPAVFLKERVLGEA